MKSWFNVGALSLASLLASCGSIENSLAEKVKPTLENIVSNDEEKDKEQIVELVAFRDYNPLGDYERVDAEYSTLKFVKHGLDATLEPADKIKIEDTLKFKKKIYDCARELGYSSEEIKSMSPRESIQLTCELVSHKLNYIGVSQDHKTRKNRIDELEKTRQLLSLTLDDPNITENQKTKILDKKRSLFDLYAQFVVVEHIESLLSDDAGYLGRNADGKPIDILFDGNQQIVCRHYADVATGVFSMLKEDNPRLNNTFVSGYVDERHKWNQVSTLTREKNGRIRLEISFFEPTWYDLRGHIEGYDSQHFSNTDRLRAQLDYLPGEKNMNPLVK